VYGELASVKGIVDLSPQEALDQAEGFLASQGYIIEQRTFTTVTAQRRPEGGSTEQAPLNVTVAIAPQPDGGVRVAVRGTDEAGVRERQAATAAAVAKVAASVAGRMAPPGPGGCCRAKPSRGRTTGSWSPIPTSTRAPRWT
jgi:hypothetical protein